MNDFAAEIRGVIGDAPADLVAFYQAGDLPVFPESQIHCLSFAEALTYSRDFNQIDIPARLGLWVLDDANDSNPFAYIGKGPCAGMIVHFTHDADPRIKFATLGGFVRALRELGLGGGDLDEIGEEQVAVPLDIPIRELLAEDSEDVAWLIVLYLTVAAGLTQETKALLAFHGDFLIREAFAAWLLRNPLGDDLALAEQLTNDSYAQVVRPAKLAVAAILRRRRCEEDSENGKAVPE